MTSTAAIFSLFVLEILLSAAVLLAFFYRGWHREFKAMAGYLVVRFFSNLYLLPIVSRWSGFGLNEAQIQATYAISFWSIYFLELVFVFVATIEIVRAIFAPYPQLANIGAVGLRWLYSLYAVVSFSTLLTILDSKDILSEMGLALMRAFGIIELSLAVFLCLGMKVLRISARDMSFGLSLGLGVLAINDLLHTALVKTGRFQIVHLQILYEALTLAGLGVWSFYSLQRRRTEEPKLLPLRTMLYRWNEVAAAIGHKETQIVRQPQTRFFLSDVEKIVDRAFEQTMKNPLNEKE